MASKMQAASKYRKTKATSDANTDSLYLLCAQAHKHPATYEEGSLAIRGLQI
jgi:hypothetical protein